MNAKELKIEAPEGYEIDWDNSSNNTIRFKPIKNKIAYKDVCRELFLNKPSWRLTDLGTTIHATCTSSAIIHHKTISTSEKQLAQLLALNKLMNVAKYLNGDWEPNFKDTDHYKYYISYDSDVKKLSIWFKQYMNDGSVYFKSEELVRQAIEILGENEVKKALGIFE